MRGGDSGAGIYDELWIPNIPESIPYSVGSSGLGVTGNNGGDASVFGSYLRLPGGKGG